MEQSDSCKCHCHTIFIAGCNYILISYRSAWLSNIFHAALMSSFNIVAEREECIRSQGYISQLIQPCTFCLSCKHFRLLCKNSLPCEMCIRDSYNTADSLIVGNFLGSNALAAVSSSGSLIFLLVGFFNGIAIGAGVVIARYFGARQTKDLQKAIHTTIGFGLISGVLLTILGILLAPKILVLMKTPTDVLLSLIHI